MNVAVIPARGGSKRIPQKNIKQFCGKPMISYSIEVASSSGIFDDIIVSTDNLEIAEISKDYGASVPFIRPAELSDDFATTVDVMAHAVKWLQDNVGELSMVCCIYAASPFIQDNDLIKAYEISKNRSWNYVFAATSFSYPIQRAIKKLENGGVEMFYQKHYGTRSQDLEEGFHDAGQFYFGKPETWINKENIFQNNAEIVVLPRWRVHDIDTEEDWLNAELIMKALIKEKTFNELQ